jgi:hypothetical protein
MRQMLAVFVIVRQIVHRQGVPAKGWGVFCGVLGGRKVDLSTFSRGLESTSSRQAPCFPLVFAALARHLAAQPGNRVVSISQRADGDLPGVRKIVYRPRREVTPRVHHYLKDVEAGILNAQEVAHAAARLKHSGFLPDLMLGHNGWGEIWYLKDVVPNTPLLGYFEFFYRSRGANVGFDPADPVSFDTAPRAAAGRETVSGLRPPTLSLPTAKSGQSKNLFTIFS